MHSIIQEVAACAKPPASGARTLVGRRCAAFCFHSASSMDHMEHIWADLPSSLLQQIMLACLPSEPLHFNRLLLPGSPDAAAAAAEQRVITVFSSTCRAWAAAAAQALQLAAWSVKAQCPAAAAADLLEQLGERRVAALDLRWLTWSEACGSGVAEALLSSLQRRSGACLQSAVGVPERLCAALAAGFPGLATVGLSEDYASTERKAHSAPMQVGLRWRPGGRGSGPLPLLFTCPRCRFLPLTSPLHPHPPAGAAPRPAPPAAPADGAGGGGTGEHTVPSNGVAADRSRPTGSAASRRRLCCRSPAGCGRGCR